MYNSTSLPTNSVISSGKYRIEKVLGQGGFGITYLATHIKLGSKAAIKEFLLILYVIGSNIM